MKHKTWLAALLGLSLIVSSTMVTVSPPSVMADLKASPTPYGLALWNKLGSQYEVEDSVVGPNGFFDNVEGQLTFTPGIFDNGVNYPFYVYHGSSMNKVAFDLSPTGLTTEKGTIEFWWIAGFTDNTLFGNNGFRVFLMTADTVIHPPDPPHSPGTGQVFFVNDNYLPSRPNLRVMIGQYGVPDGGWAATDPSSHDFDEGDQIHWAIAYDANGIGTTGKTLILYKNGVEIASDNETWDPAPIKTLWVGVLSSTWYGGNTRKLGYNSAAGVYDNLRIWNYAKTNFDDRFYEAPTIPVSIDIKPGSDPNSINLKSKGVVPVAVLTTEDFDASTVLPDTVLFADAAPLRWTTEDVDGDGDDDLLFKFRTQELNLDQNSTAATLTGETSDAWRIEGTDAVNIVPKGK
jgi:hypothetical protein